MFDLAQIFSTFSDATNSVMGAIGIGGKIRDLIMSDPKKAADELIAMNNQLLSVQTALLKAQQLVMEITQQNQQLSEQLKRFDAWENEKSQYQIVEIASLSYAYVKTPPDGATTLPYFCASCFNERKLALLQSSDKTTAVDNHVCKILICTNCNHEVLFNTGEKSATYSVGRSRSSIPNIDTF